MMEKELAGRKGPPSDIAAFPLGATAVLKDVLPLCCREMLSHVLCQCISGRAELRLSCVSHFSVDMETGDFTCTQVRIMKNRVRRAA
jgi:hypothetical protein